jgi:hypothetical protein
MLKPYKGSITYIKKIQSVSIADAGFNISQNHHRKGEMKMKREFHVKTPMGDLHIYAKHENSDIMADYPGVYVELLREGCEPELLACTEYDSGTHDMLTTVYDIGRDDPVVVHHHCEFADTEREENRDAQ